MPNAYTWQFESLDVYPTYETVTDAVESMHWRLTGDDGLGHTAEAYGEVKAGPVDVDNFIPFVSLTATVVEGWTEAALGAELDAVKAYLDARIQQIADPPTVSHPPPWL